MTRYKATIEIEIEQHDDDFQDISFKQASQIAQAAADEARDSRLDIGNGVVRDLHRLPDQPTDE